MKQNNKSIKSKLKKYKYFIHPEPINGGSGIYIDEEEMEILLEKISISNFYQNLVYRLQYTEVFETLDEEVELGLDKYSEEYNFYLFYAGFLIWLRFRVIRKTNCLSHIFISKKELMAYQIIGVFTESIIKQMMYVRGFLKTMEEYGTNS